MAQPNDSTMNLESIAQALDASLSATISNETRREALQYLENVKTQLEAPTYGIALAQDRQQTAAVRHYGLQILEYAIRYRWNDYGNDETTQLREWIVNLARNVVATDPNFISNKIAQLWTECAKRSWGDQWLDMDSQLLILWNNTSDDVQFASKVLVLCVLETLAEDICNREDTIAGLRSEVLGNALNEVVISRAIYDKHISTKEGTKTTELRSAGDGWLSRIRDVLMHCLTELERSPNSNIAREVLRLAIKATDTLKTIVSWVSLRAIIDSNVVETLAIALRTNDTTLRTAALEIMTAIYSRPSNAHFKESELALLQLALDPTCLQQLLKIFQLSESQSFDEEEVYTLQKKSSELLAALSDHILSNSHSLQSSDLSLFFAILANAFQSTHLIVSIPVLHSWMKLLAAHNTYLMPYILEHLNTIITTCSERLFSYESLPQDAEHPLLQLLYLEFDTMPERHAFLGNYRRYCISIIETIAYRRPLDASTYITSQIVPLLESGPFARERGLDLTSYNKSSKNILQFDAQFSVMMSVLKGIAKCESEARHSVDQKSSNNEMSGELDNARQVIRSWSTHVMSIHIEDPEIVIRMVTLLSNVVRNILRQPDMANQFVNYTLSLAFTSDDKESTYHESIKNFHAASVIELQKTALVFADSLLDQFPALQQRTEKLVQIHNDSRLRWGYSAFLFMIVQRTSKLQEDIRITQLRSMLEPVLHAWQDQRLKEATSTLDGLFEVVKLQDLPQFWQQYKFAQTPDWSTQDLDAEGKARQDAMKDSLDNLPLRMTKSLLAATTEKLSEDSQAFDTASALWEPIIPVILPTLLNMIKQAQAFSNLTNWSHLPNELQEVVKRTLQDRFWQSGISNESRDEFYARINGSKSSYEGFSSSVRGTMRNVREQGYHIVFLLTKFEQSFYGLSDLPEHLARCLFDDAHALSANHLQSLINLATGLVQRCPPQHQRSFIPPILIHMFSQLDKKISGEWESILQATQNTGEEDDLSEEMRGESVLRQLTFSLVSFIMLLFQGDNKRRSQLSDLILTDTSILEPLILFCTHAIRMRDTRCCTAICKILSNIAPVFTSDNGAAPQIREFISTEVMMAGITSLNEPYFADMQKDLAGLLAHIIALYSRKTSTPQRILLSLPDMREDKVKRAIEDICSTKTARKQRAHVLNLLEGVRGVSVHESGKILQRADLKKQKDSVAKKYMQVEEKATITNGEEVGLDSLAGLFNQD